MSDKVVSLEFGKPDETSFISCAACGNKTFTIVEDVPDHFPLMRCGACGHRIGRIAWAPEGWARD